MAGSADYREWLKAGQPATTMRPVADLCRTLHGHGYNVGRMDIPGLGDERHLLDLTPEDHTPYSHSGWPVNPTPRWWVTAFDLMRVSDKVEAPAGKPSILAVMTKLRADRIAGRPQVAWIKYINWTDAAGHCWHDSWQPNYHREPSADKGHGHVSGRSDMLDSAAAARYDPIAELMGGDDMAIDQAGWDALIWRVEALINGRPAVIGGPRKGETVKLAPVDVAAIRDSAAGMPFVDAFRKLVTDVADLRVQQDSAGMDAAALTALGVAVAAHLKVPTADDVVDALLARLTRPAAN